MVGHPHVQELMGDHEILKPPFLINKVTRQGDDAFGRA